MKKLFTLLVMMLSIIHFNLNAQENAFTVDYAGGVLTTIDLTDASQTTVGTAFGGMGGMEFGPDNVLYGMNSSANQLFEVDTSDATTTLVGSSPIPATHIWTGLAYDPSSGIMYGMAAHGTATGSANLYEVDLTDGSTTLIGSQGTATALSCLAIDDNGVMYSLDLSASPEIYTVDMTDGSVTLVGITGEFGGAGMGYGMDFNSDDQTMYLTAYDSFTFNSALYTINLTNGSATEVGSLPIWTSGLAIISPFESEFSADQTTVCTGSTVNFSDESSGASSWSWTFEGGTPSTSTDQNPSVVYSTPGTYDVELTVMNNSGSSDTETKYDYINVLETPAQADAPDGDEEVCTGNVYAYETAEVLYAEDYEWEIDPVDAGTLDTDMNEANLTVADDWTGDFTISVRAINMCGDGDWSDDLEGTVYQSPDEFSLQGGGGYCLGGDGVELTLDGSQTGIEYELYLDGEATGITVDGTGSELSFGVVMDEGFYEAYGSNDNCELAMSNQVQVWIDFPPLEPGTPVGPESICEETSSDYTSEGSDDADSYVWELTPEDAGTITSEGLEATVEWNSEFTGLAYVSLYGINDCGDGNSSTELEVSIGAPTPIVEGEDLVCDWSDEVYTATEIEGSTYTWEVTGGTISEGQGTYMITVSWTGEGNGTVSVEEETADDCSGSSEVFDVMIDDCTGIGENNLENQISLNPNPAIEYILIKSDEVIDEVTILNLQGQVVANIQANQGQLRINTESYKPGIYVARVTADDMIMIKRFVIK